MSMLMAELADLGRAKVVQLQEAYRRYQDKEGFDFALIEGVASGDKMLARNASWLLKRFLESGRSLEKEGLELLESGLEFVDFWETRLHLCQIFASGKIFAELSEEPVMGFVRQSMSVDNKFVRAWALSALVEIALENPEYHAEALEAVEVARIAEAPKSVQARLRRLGEKL